MAGSSSCLMKFYTDRPREKHLNVLRVLNSSLLDFFFFSYWQGREAGWQLEHALLIS